jgi:hypothetical protein
MLTFDSKLRQPNGIHTRKEKPRQCNDWRGLKLSICSERVFTLPTERSDTSQSAQKQHGRTRKRNVFARPLKGLGWDVSQNHVIRAGHRPCQRESRGQASQSEEI